SSSPPKKFLDIGTLVTDLQRLDEEEYLQELDVDSLIAIQISPLKKNGCGSDTNWG
ncbi:hypothetical protein HAX54_005907, partial [Datura stramonium]|nr:hypothetical protein [Datura stramonium]